MTATNDQPMEFHLALRDAGSSAVELLALRSGLSRGQIRRAMDRGAVWLTRGRSTRRIRRRNAGLCSGDTLHLYYNPVVLATEPAAATLVADYSGYSVWVKPAGMRSQGSRWGDHTTLPRWAEKHLRPQRKAFVVHRLDRAASGLMLLAHDKRSAAGLSRLFRERRVGKRYRVVVHGRFADDGLRMDALLDGREAGSEAHRLSYDAERDRSLLDVAISTGRKHQIRRHLAGQGFAVVGDRLYGSANDDEDLQLCAVQLTFDCPLSGEPRCFDYAPVHRR